MAKEFICSVGFQPGSHVRLNPAMANEATRLLIGTGNVLQILWHVNFSITENGDGDLCCIRFYTVRAFRGRVFEDLPDTILIAIPPEEVTDRRKVHAEMTEALAAALFG